MSLRCSAVERRFIGQQRDGSDCSVQSSSEGSDISKHPLQHLHPELRSHSQARLMSLQRMFNFAPSPIHLDVDLLL